MRLPFSPFKHILPILVTILRSMSFNQKYKPIKLLLDPLINISLHSLNFHRVIFNFVGSKWRSCQLVACVSYPLLCCRSVQIKCLIIIRYSSFVIGSSYAYVVNELCFHKLLIRNAPAHEIIILAVSECETDVDHIYRVSSIHKCSLYKLSCFRAQLPRFYEVKFRLL